MKKLLAVIALLYGVTAFAQTEEEAVKTAVNKLFTAMKQSDSAALMQCFTADAILQTIKKDKAGNTKTITENVNGFAAQVAVTPKDSADERIQFRVVKTDANLAIVWTPYSFYYAGKFSHCGVNSFQLLKTNGAWKIHYLIDTRRKDNCATEL